MRPTPGEVTPIRPASHRTPCVFGLIAVAVGAVVLTGCSAGQRAQTAEETSVVDGSGGSVGDIHLSAVSVAAAPIAGWSKGDSAPLQLLITNAGLSSDSLTGVSSPVSPAVQFADNAAALTQTCAPSSAATPSATAIIPVPSSGTPTAAGSPAATSAAASTPAAATGTSVAGSTGSAAATGSAAVSTTATPSTSPSPTCSAAPTVDSIDLAPNRAVTIGLAAGDKQLILTKLTTDIYPGQAFPVTFTFAQAGSVTVNVSVHLNTSAPVSASIVPSLTGE